MTSQDWLTIEQFAQLTNRNYQSAKRWLNRRKWLDFRTPVINGKRHLFVSAESLLLYQFITHDQLKEFTGIESIKMESNEGNQLLASSIVRKKFSQLTDGEIELLNTIPHWQEMQREEIVRIFIDRLKKSRAWFYRDHSKDGRKEKENALLKLNVDQLRIVDKLLVTCRLKKSFVESCQNSEHLPDLSERTWYRIYNQLNLQLANEVEYAKTGHLKMRSKIAPILRDKTVLNPLDVIVGDFWRVDFATKWVDGSLVRPSCAVWVDWRTHKIVGTALTRFPNSLGVKTSLLHCFLHHGIPLNAYIDNGKEYLAHRVYGTKVEEKLVRLDLAEVDDKLKVFEAKGFLPSMGINSKRALIRNPQAKIIERLFGRGGFTDYAKEFSNWIGENYWKTPEAVSRAARKFRQGDEREFVDERTGEVIHFMDLGELSDAIRYFVHRHNERISNGFGMDGMSPNQLWDELVKANPPRRASVERIAYSFMEGKMLRVRGSGYIEFKKHFFFTNSQLMNMRGQDVHIRWNPIDGFWWNRGDERQFEFLPNSLFVYNQHAEYVCNATFVERNHPIEADVSTVMKNKNGILKGISDNLGDILGPKPAVVDTKIVPTEALQEAEEKRKLLKAKEEEDKKNNSFRNTFI